MLKRHNDLFLTSAVLFDAAFIAAAWMLCYYLRFRLGLLSFVETQPPGPATFAYLLPIVVGGMIFAAYLTGLYNSGASDSTLREWIRVVKASALGWLIIQSVFYYISSAPYSRKLLLVFLLVTPFTLMAARIALRKLLIKFGRSFPLKSRAAIIGTGRIAQELFDRLQACPWLGISVQYFVAENDSSVSQMSRATPVAGCVKDLPEILEARPVETVFVALSGWKSNYITHVLNDLARLSVSVAVVPDFSGTVTMRSGVADLAGLPIITLRDSPIRGWNAAAKRMLDVAGATALLAISCLPMLLLALLVKLSSRGPIFYRQERMGLGGQPFIMLKFRSMRVDAEKETGPVWARRGDPRCTIVGRIMRRTGLDELPQLLNVLRGDMSLVGPRPERPVFVRQFAETYPGYALRHSVKAGITGWAQVNGLRGQSSLQKRLQYDLYYINNWSLSFDIFIVALTPFSGVTSKNAY